MTTSTVPLTTTAPAAPNRIRQVIAMQLLNKQTFIWLPLTILGGSFAISLMIYGIINFSVDDLTDPIYGGGSQAPLWYFLAVGVTALSYTFPFSQAVSITRREYFLGTYATAVLTSLTLAVTFLIGGLIERATDGWWFDGYFFYLPWIWDQTPVVAVLLYFAIAMFAFSVGFLGATVYKRFGTPRLVMTGIAIVLVLVLAGLIISLVGGWPAVGRWIVDMRPLTLVGIFAVLDVAIASASYLTLRRATP